jgi:hypothetical protein
MISTIAISKRYLRGRPQPHFSTSWGNCSEGFVGSCTVLSVLDS